MKILYALFIINLVTAVDKEITTTETSDICDTDNSCNTTTTVDVQTEKVSSSEKWKYNVSDGINVVNETLLDIFHGNETNTTVTLETDSSNQVNKSTGSSENKPTNNKFQVHLNENCFCDTTRGSCDINCCCDPDCLTVNRDVFKHCIGVDHTEEDKYCPSKILNSPFLCIVKDNLYSKHFYPQHQVAEEITNVDKQLKNREVYGWSFPSLPSDDFADFNDDFKEYELGSRIWILDNQFQIKVFRLPKSTVSSRDCTKKEPMKFLQEFDETCAYRLKDTFANECEKNNSIFNALRYFSNFTFIANPGQSNYSAPLNCSDNCIPVTPFICDTDDLDACVKLNSSKAIPSFSPKTNTCSRAVTSVHYKIIHNGTEGILSVHLYLQLSDIVFKSNLLWAIPFTLTYQWTNQNESFKVSGFPGYEAGKPIITGFRLPQLGKENKYSEVVQSSYNPKHWLTVFRTGNSGLCLKNHRDNILFQENLYTHCFVYVPKIRTADDCEKFQSEIFKTIFGTQMNLSNIYISTLGDPNFKDKKKWAPFIIDFPNSVLSESCHGIITSVKIIILYASVGLHDNPQLTITGIKVTGNSIQKNISKYDSIKVSFAINFYDVTSPPLRIFAEPPTYEVKLPTDFFYPFFSNSCSLHVSNILFLVLVIFYYLFLI